MPSELGLHPALNSFINAFTARKRQVRQDERDEAHDKQQEITNKLNEKKFQEEMKQHQAEIDHRNEILQMTQKMQHLQARKTVGDLVRGGSLKPNDNSGNDSQVSIPGQLPKPDLYNVGGYQFNTSEVGSPEEQGQAELAYKAPVIREQAENIRQTHEIDAAGRMAQAMATAKARLDQEEFRQKKQSEEKEKDRTNVRDIAGIHESGANSRNASSNSARLTAAQIAAGGGNNGNVPSYWNSVATGKAPIDNITTAKDSRAKATEYAVNEGIGYYTKKDEENAKPLVKEIATYKNMKDFVDKIAEKDPAKDEGSALKRRLKYSNQTIATMGGSGDLYRKYSTEIIPQAAGFGRIVGERGAFTEKDAAKYKTALVGPHQSDASNYETLKFMYDGFVRATKAQFPNIKADHIDNFLEEKYKITPPEKMDYTPGGKLGKIERIGGKTYILQSNGNYKEATKAEGGK